MQDDASPAAIVDTVVKLGGSVLADAALLDAAVRAIGVLALGRRLLVVPGGGLFADAVREADRRLGLSDDAAHWMAVLAMDQAAHLVAGRLARGRVVTEQGEIAGVPGAGQVPVLAPYAWLKATDPLPHTWEVTGDSIAAWVAGRVGARNLVLIKPPGVTNARQAVDVYFPQALPEGIRWTVVPADRVDATHLSRSKRTRPAVT
jgi:aspartokinase-like uncharacterized kinase